MESALGERKGAPMNARFSVLMSVYKNDSPEFLDVALKSIYEAQTRKPDEIVVVFDGPLTPGLLEVLDRFRIGKERVVKYYPQEENRGLGEALRIGSGKCTGDYIFRMDSDDVSAPCRFEKQAAYVEAHPEIDVVGTDMAEFGLSPDEPGKRVRACPARHEDIVRMGKKRNPMNHVTVCMKKKALEACGGYRTLLLLEDYYLWLHMIAAGCKLANINESLVYVRVGNGFDSKRGAKARIAGWKVLQDFMLGHGMITRKEARWNMLCVWGFVSTPAWLKKVLYQMFLRK
jgi:glycosyltransferase involved in cell wall biosynthesis